jgi:hypothetical protein
MAGMPVEKRENRINSVADVVKTSSDRYAIDHRGREQSILFFAGRLAHVKRLLGTLLLSDGSLTITISHAEPDNAVARANWLPAPEGQFALIVRAYVPTQPVRDGSYKLPNVERVQIERLR